MKEAIRTLRNAALLMVGQPCYETYLRHMAERHPEQADVARRVFPQQGTGPLWRERWRTLLLITQCVIKLPSCVPMHFSTRGVRGRRTPQPMTGGRRIQEPDV
jgi:uncharacterized short protein YbdD (DUF466 family)